MEDFIRLIDNLPQLFLYVFPGLFGVYIFKIFAMRRFGDAAAVLWSMAVSYTTICAITTVTKIPISEAHIGRTAMLCFAIDGLLGIILAIIWRSGWFNAIVGKLFQLTLQDDALSGIIAWHSGANAEIYFKSRDYWVLGHIATIDAGSDGWFCVRSPIKYNRYNQEIESFEDQQNVFEAYPMSEIERITIIN